MTAQEKQVKMYTIELTENELARALFVMRYVNGVVYGQLLASHAFEKLDVQGIGIDDFESKVAELAKRANLPKIIDYYSIQRDWEAFLGVGEESKNNDILDKIANMERELTELKGML